MDNSHYTPDRATNGRHEQSASGPGENKFLATLKKPVVFIPLILLLVILGVYLYKESQLNDVRRRAEQEKAAVIQRANERISENNEYLLEVLMKPFSWSVRTALLSGNVDQVNQYLFQLVQEDKFPLVLVADADGTVISSTDQNFTGAAFADHFNAEYLGADSTVIDDSDPNRVVVASPVMGLNSKLGTILAVYQPGEPLQQQQE